MGNVLQYYRALNRDSAPVSTPFISTWRTTNTSSGSSASNQIKLPLPVTGTYDFIVDWGDGSSDNITIYNQSEITHTYSSSGDKTLTITGTCVGFNFNVTGDRLKILDISQWGNIEFIANTSIINGCFANCSNLNISASDSPKLSGECAAMFRNCTSLTGTSAVNSWDLSSVTNLDFFFAGATSFNQNIGAWDVSACTRFNGVFFGASAFNNGGSDSIKDWDVSLGTNFGGGGGSGMFASSPFNQPIGTWDMSSATVLQSMFQSNTAFNQNIGAWDVGSVVDFRGIFNAATAFNNGGSDSIKDWDVSSATVNLTSISLGTFRNATSFNQPLTNWDVSNCTNLAGMFLSSTSFNQNIGGWNVSSSTSFNGMFTNSGFNNGGSDSIKDWDVSNCQGFGGASSGMFRNCPFNQPIGTWDMSSAVALREMFALNTAFNQDLSAWDVSNVTNMISVFQSASSFNQNIGGWNVSKVSDFTGFMSGKTAANFSTANLDAIYNGWSALTFVNTGLNISFGTIKYTAASSAGRAILTGAPNNWTITDGGI